MSRPGDWWVLDLERDPTPGDPVGVRRLAWKVQRVANDASATERDVCALAGEDAVSSWVGCAGDVFRPALDGFPRQLAMLAESYDQAAQALFTWATELDDVQDQSLRALEDGREARADIASLTSQLASARDAASSAGRAADSLRAPLDPGVAPPDPAQVRSAVRNASAANSRVTSLSGSLDAAEARLERAKRLARDAEQLRQRAGDRAAGRLRDASDAGMQPKSRWDRFKDGVSKVWDATISIAKVAVAVLGIVALIIGGPLVWIVVGLSVLIVADALLKVASGEGSWWDVAFAAIGLIPGGRGLTSVAAIKNAYAAGKLGGVAAHFGARGRDLAQGARAVWQGRGALPILARQLPGTARARLANMAADLRHGVPGGLRGFYAGVRHTPGVLGRTRGGFEWGGVGFRHARETFRTAAMAGGDPVYAARTFQGRGAYFGVDDWRATALRPGQQLETGYPGVGTFAVPRGTMDDLGRDAARYNESVQVGPGTNPAYDAYRAQGLRLDVVHEVPAATSVARANPQFGAGGSTQFYVPDLPGRLASGDLVAVGPNGNPLPVSVDGGRVTVTAPNGSLIDMTNFGPSTNPSVFTPDDFQAVQTGLRDVRDIGRTVIGVPLRGGRIS